MFPWVGVVILYLCKLLFRKVTVWKGKVTSCHGNTKEKRLCFQYDISVFSNFMKSDYWMIYYKLAVTAWKSRPKSFPKYENMLEKQESSGNLITSCNWGILNFLIQAVLVFNQYLFWKTNTAKNKPIVPKLLMRCLSFFTQLFMNDWSSLPLVCHKMFIKEEAVPHK